MPMNSNLGRAPTMQTVLDGLGARSNALLNQYLECSRQTLQMIIDQPGLLNGIELESVGGGYARNLLFGDGKISIWAMTWSPGSSTSIHDHHCSCCFGVVAGSLTEVRYVSLDHQKVKETERLVRRSGFIDCLLPSGPNIHLMANNSEEDAVSIHIYGYDHNLHASSIRAEYVAVYD